MKKIKLSQQGKKRALNLVALVDDQDYEYLKQWKWYAFKQRNTFYAARGVYRRNDKRTMTLMMHRVVMSPANNKIDVDHIDRNGLNNQKNNLRLCSQSQNSANRPSKRNSSSKYLGVSWCNKNNKWRTVIVKNRKFIHIGYFKMEEDAALAYNKAALIYHREFSNLNEINPNSYETTINNNVAGAFKLQQIL